DVGADHDALSRRLGHPLVQRTAQRARLRAVGAGVRGESHRHPLHLRLGALDDPAPEIRPPDETRLEGVPADGGRKRGSRRALYYSRVDMSWVTRSRGLEVSRRSAQSSLLAKVSNSNTARPRNRETARPK